MKFAQELDQDAVPEWKAKYFDYRLAKKKLKALQRTLNQFSQSPNAPAFHNPFTPAANDNASTFQTWRRRTELDREAEDDVPPETPDPNAHNALTRQRSKSTPNLLEDDVLTPTESLPLVMEGGSRKNQPPMTRYGSIIGSPPKEPVQTSSLHTDRPPSLRLPDPAMRAANSPLETRPKKSVRIRDGADVGQSAYEAGRTKPAPSLRSRHLSIAPKSMFSRFRSLSTAGPSPGGSFQDYQLDAYREVENAYSQFFGYLDEELDKVDTFYKQKEQEAAQRLIVMRGQLHILRDRRIEDLIKSRQTGGSRATNRQSANTTAATADSDSDEDRKLKPRWSWLQTVDSVWDTAMNGRIGRKSVALESETTPVAFRPDDTQDYVRRPHEDKVPYRSAKRKLKLAMQEFYRGLELLKSYAMLNRTAFRKMNKKYDKNLNAKPTGSYMTEKVNKSWFVQSNVLDDQIQQVEDLYARYFEAGNRKIAANKLRKGSKIRDYHGGAMFRNGAYLSSGLIFGIQGLVNGVELLYSEDATMATNTSYLLQIYAGYFLMLLLMMLFALACRFWTLSKVNYVFVFEFETKDHLDWRQILELPCLFTTFLGFFLWINFAQYGADDMYVYYPTVLIVVTAAIIFCPLPIVYQRARSWFLVACSRLLLSGLFPVEFRDFFLGDMFCSTSYSMGNIELFFCLYAHHWANPPICNSSSSRLLGFFTTLPGIWRALQCIRRYADTKNAFPHLANCVKYGCTIMYYVSLSLYRIDRSTGLKGLFITAASVNSLYCSIWDLVMDWSLLDFTAPRFLLRETLAYRQTWIYYAAMIIDPILRFNWVFYAIYADDLQHSTVVSFAVGLSEVLRRGMWTIFRVENEHCTNVGRFRASRDVPLPFEVHEETRTPVDEETAHGTAPAVTPEITVSNQQETGSPHLTRFATGSDRSRPSPSMRIRKAAEQSPLVRGLSRVGSVLHLAHAQDFERRRRPEVESVLVGAIDSDSSEDEGETLRTLRVPDTGASSPGNGGNDRIGGRRPDVVFEEEGHTE